MNKADNAGMGCVALLGVIFLCGACSLSSPDQFIKIINALEEAIIKIIEALP